MGKEFFPQPGNFRFGPGQIAVAGALEKGAEKPISVGGVDGDRVGLLEPDGVDIEQPRGPTAAWGGRQEDVSGIEIGMADALSPAVGQQLANRGKNPGPFPGPWAGGKQISQVFALGNEGGDNFQPVKRAGGIKKNGLNLWRADAHLCQAGGSLDLAEGARWAEIKITGQTAPPTAVETGSDHQRAKTWKGGRDHRAPTDEVAGIRMATGHFA